MTRLTTIPALASAARTTSGVVDLGALPAEYDSLDAWIDVTAVSGTAPTITFTYQASPNGVTFFDRTSGTAITAAGKQLISITSGLSKFGRLSYVIAGTTPSLTFSVIVEARRTGY